jgi:hypothetical protein
VLRVPAAGLFERDNETREVFRVRRRDVHGVPVRGMSEAELSAV